MNPVRVEARPPEDADKRGELRHWRIDVSCEYRDRDLVRTIPGARWDRTRRTWHIPLTWNACVQSRSTFGDRLEIGPVLLRWATDEAERVRRRLELRELKDAPGDERLFNFQRVGVQFLKEARAAALGDDVGTGKTVQLIQTLEELDDAYPALVVCPNSVKGGWAAEYEKWAPHRKVVVVGNGASKRRKALAEEADVYVINREALRLHTRLAAYGNIRLSDKEKELGELNEMPLRTVIADEGHHFVNPQAKQTRALWAVGEGTAYRYVASGTITVNAMDDLWAPMHFVAPEEFPTRTAYLERYALMLWNPFGHMEVAGVKPEMRKEFYQVLDHRFIRRPKRAVLADLPPVVHMPRRELELRGKQKKAYETLRKEMIAMLDDGSIVKATNPLTQLTRLLQLASSYAELDDEGHFRMTEPSCKLDELITAPARGKPDGLLPELGDQQSLIFAESRQLLELAAVRMAKADVSHGLFTGAVPVSDRERLKERYQAGDVQHLLLTYGAGGEGLTLTAASVVIRLQRSPSRVRNIQALGRPDRPGQEAEKISVIDLLTVDTVEERVEEILETKDAAFEEVVRDADAFRRLLG